MITNYSLGFIFNKELDKVLLIKLNKPGQWNHELINGVGGKFNFSENFKQCMVRECEEETGLNIEDWNYIGNFCKDEEFNVYTFYSIIESSNAKINWQCPEGFLQWYNINDLNKLSLVENAKWMILYCLQKIKSDIRFIY